VERYLPDGAAPSDPMMKTRHPALKDQALKLPAEVVATRSDPAYWLQNMLRDHQYTWEEVTEVMGRSPDEVRGQVQELHLDIAPAGRGRGETFRLLPYPGGRHPRIGFLEGAILPHRGTKASVFLPWDSQSYAVIDLPEAIFSNLGLTYLAHTHIPTIWDAGNLWLENIDWDRAADGSLTGRRLLPNQIGFGASIRPSARQIEMELWLRNNSPETLNGLRTQICVMLKGAEEFNKQTNDNKVFRSPVSAVGSTVGNRWILTAWERCGRTWGNALCPCMHSDPLLPDCAPGQTVRVKGRLWFYEGEDIEGEIERAGKQFSALPAGK
jgi:hypothetical protein